MQRKPQHCCGKVGHYSENQEEKDRNEAVYRFVGWRRTALRKDQQLVDRGIVKAKVNSRVKFQPRWNHEMERETFCVERNIYLGQIPEISAPLLNR